MSSYIQGIDCSKWQGDDIRWDVVANAGYAFAFLKSSEGVGYEDPCWKRNWAAARDAGIVRGAYHFARVSREIEADARAEADWMLKVVGEPEAGDLPPALDIEWDQRADGISASEIVEWCSTFLEHVEARIGRAPLVYTGPSFWRYRLAKTDALQRFPLWEASYTEAPQPKPLGDWRWTFWQFTSKGVVPGIAGKVDTNRFHGTRAQLDALAGRSCTAHEATEPTPAPPGFDVPTIDLAQPGRSPNVMRVQGLLLAHGFGPAGLLDANGHPDGLPGPATRKAMKTFKHRHRLEGKATLVDPPTWWALLTADGG